jgi:DNA modification methylase
MSESFLGGRVFLEAGDCREVLAEMPSNMFHACVTDPPYHLTSIVKRFGAASAAPPKEYAQYAHKGANPYKRGSTGFMGKQWDGGDIAFQPELWADVLRVLKPGGHLLACGGTRTFHRLVCAIEDAGFEIRDTISWLYGSGFPKSHDVSRGIDRALGFEREKVRYAPRPVTSGTMAGSSDTRPWIEKSRELGYHELDSDTPVSLEADRWHGWGTSLKPSHEDLVLAQKPVENSHYINTIGSNLLRLWCQLWSILPARRAAELSMLSPHVCGVDQRVFVQWDAANSSNIRAALCGRMDMSLFELAMISSLSTVSSWALTWAESWTPENTCIIETGLKTTTDLRTLSYLLSRITVDSIILAHKSGRWSVADASNAERCFHASVLKLQGILELSAVAPALLKAAGDSLDVGVSPALEQICLARKPLSEATISANVLRWGTGALNIDATRISAYGHDIGRWPSNMLHDGSPEVVAAFPDTHSYCTNPDTAAAASNKSFANNPRNVAFLPEDGEFVRGQMYADSGSAARFFYTSKADSDDRAGSKHPTVKPLDLIQYLCRLICPPGGTVLDPFAGTGTTGEAAWREGFEAMLIERDAAYRDDIRRRMALALAGPDERARESVKARGRVLSPGPLFDGLLESAE